VTVSGNNIQTLTAIRIFSVVEDKKFNKSKYKMGFMAFLTAVATFYPEQYKFSNKQVFYEKVLHDLMNKRVTKEVLWTTVRSYYETLYKLICGSQTDDGKRIMLYCDFEDSEDISVFKGCSEKVKLERYKIASGLLGEKQNPGKDFSKFILNTEICFDGSESSALQMLYYDNMMRKQPKIVEVIS
jgi:hypothetical protein